MTSKQPVFIIGASRSGTTLLLRMMDAHSEITGYSEIHYYDELLARHDKDVEVLQKRTVARALRGYHAAPLTTDPMFEGSNSLNEVLTMLCPTPVWVEKTPQYAFHLEQILREIPNARFISIIRDPRNVAASQKKKWRRRFLGGSFMPLKEVIRLFINYHPFLVAKLWDRTYVQIEASNVNASLFEVQFEQLISQPKEVLEPLCRWLNLTFEPAMLEVPQASSSHEADQAGIGLRQKRKQGDGLTKTETYILEKVCAERMVKYNYTLEKPSPSLIHWVWSWVFLVLKLPVIVLFNLHRLKNPLTYISKRW